ncbi:uncharacterized protein LOC107632888 [Arachis ipaensis]|uniref:uncharacterized protein LOC107632888 n=1 Tax=Arachis ipaensis TaxID=130454 RepID=UPI0007AFB43B|nr:uncharacterized protein LOC107632888 [Arachis ipaensis]
MNADVAEVTNVLANQQPFQEPSFTRSLDLEAMHAPEFPQYMNTAKLPIVVDSEFTVGMKFSSREAIIKVMKDYTIRRGVDYRVYELEPTTFYAKYSKTVAETIKPLVEVDPSIKVKSVIAEVQSKFNYTISYRKVWLAKQKAVESIFEGWEASYEALPIWFEAMCYKEPSAVVHFEIMPAYQGDDLVPDICVLHRVFWNYYPLEGKTSEAWYFFLSNLRQHVVTRDGVGLISDRHDSIRLAIARSNGAWSPPRAFHMFCIRHIESNFLRKFKTPYLQKLIVNIGYSRTIREY